MSLRTFLFAVVASGLILLPEGSQAQTRAQARAQRRHATSGKVKSVNPTDKSFVVMVQEKKAVLDVTVKTTAQTRYLKGVAPASLADVQPQKWVRVIGSGASTAQVTAEEVDVSDHAPVRASDGTVKSVDAAGHTFVVSAGKPGKEQALTVQVTEQTRIASGRQPAQLSDVAVGQRVRVVPVEGTEPGAIRFTASQVLLRKPKAAAPAAPPAHP